MTILNIPKNETPAECLARIAANPSTANFGVVAQQFMERGVAPCDILPKQNVLTFKAWIATGRVVKKGEKGVKIDVTFPVMVKDKATGESVKKLSTRSVTVFHESQTTVLELKKGGAGHLETVQ